MTTEAEPEQRLMSLLSRVMKLDPEEREHHLRLACAGDQQLYEEIRETIAWEQRMGNFLQEPLIRLQDPARVFSPGQVLSGRFQIIREVGEGGMGVVYEAFDPKRNQRIAIKCAKPGFHHFLSPEVNGALRVRHPNVCLVNEIHTAQTKTGEVDFLTMEFLEGETLASRLAECGRLPVRDAIDIARQLSDGLKAAHRSSVVHGDLKAENIILCATANARVRPVITDFGLSGESGSNALCGTPRYMAPELWLGEKASPASDVYALGVILHEMAAGKRPPAAGCPESGLDIRPMPRFYSRMVEGCLSIDPARRLHAFSEGMRALGQEKSSWTRRKLLLSGAGGVGLASVSVWFNRDKIQDRFHPLPEKRFVALLPWPPDANPQNRPLVTGILTAVENELSRAEAADRNLYVISAHQVGQSAQWKNEIREFCKSVGANLVLGASLVSVEQQFRLELIVQNAATSVILRQKRIVSELGELSNLISKAVLTAAALLDVRPSQGEDRKLRTTDSVAALAAFHKAEEAKSKPNDAGLEEAIEQYRKAIEADPRYVAAYAKLAIAYARLHAMQRDPGALELAQRNAEKAISMDARPAEGHLALAVVWEARGNEQMALEEIERATKLDPNDSRTLLWRAQICKRFKRWTEAEQAYQQLRRERPNYWLAYQQLGVLLNAQGRYQEAMQAFRAATIAAPGIALSFSNLGALQFKSGDLTRAEESFRKSVSLKPNDLAYANLAEAVRAQGKYSEAIRFGKEAVKLNPANDQNWLSLGDSHAAMGGVGQAQQAYRRAMLEVEQRLRTDSTDSSAWARLALYSAKTGSRARVPVLLKKAGQYGAADVDSDLHKARALEVIGERQNALSVLASCFRRGTTDFEVASTPDLKNLRRDPLYKQIQRSDVPKTRTDFAK